MYTSTFASRDRTQVSRETLSVTSTRRFSMRADCAGSTSRSAMTDVSTTAKTAGSSALMTSLPSDFGM